MIATLLIAALALPPDSSAADSARAPHSISASAADTARSSAADSVVMVLPETRIERERPVDPARRRLPTAFTSVIPVGQSNRALESLSEVLGEAAGVHVDRYGGLGAFSTVSMRGSTPGQVSVYLDGAPLMSAGQSVVNLSDLPAGAIDHVEVYRGLSPLAFGPATPGGAINLVTAPAAATREARVTYGSFDTWEARASAGGTRGTLAAQIDGGLQSSRGDFVFLDDHGTPYNLADDREHPRENNRFDAASLFGTLRWRARPNLDVALREDFFHKAQGLPGIGTSTSQNARLASLRSMTQLEIARRAAAGPAPDGAARLLAAPDARFAVSLERQQNRFRDDGGPLGLGELKLGRHNSDDRLANGRGTLELAWPRLPAGLALTAAGSAGVEHAALHDPEDGYPDPPPSQRDARGVALGADWSLARDVLRLHAARRWHRIVDHLRTNGVAGAAIVSDVTRELDSPQLGARLALPLGLEARANWARAERAPDFLELFGNQGTVTGNPNLRPETAENRDAGLAWSAVRGARSASLEWAHFETLAHDLILYWGNSANTTRADNITSARIRGEEFTARARPFAALSISGSATWQSAIDTGPYSAWHGKRLPQRPGREGYLRADATHHGWRVSSDVQYLADDYRDRYNSPRYRVASRTIVGASISSEFAGPARWVVEGKNLGDRRLADVAGYPLPGRSVFVSMEVRLGPAGSARP